MSLVSSPSPAFAPLPGAFVDSANPLCLSTAWDFERLACSLGRALRVCRWTTPGAFGMRSGLRTGVRVGLQSGLCPPSLPYRFPLAARAPDALPAPRRRFALLTRLPCHRAHGSPAVPSPSAGLRVSEPASPPTRRAGGGGGGGGVLEWKAHFPVQLCPLCGQFLKRSLVLSRAHSLFGTLTDSSHSRLSRGSI